MALQRDRLRTFQSFLAGEGKMLRQAMFSSRKDGIKKV